MYKCTQEQSTKKIVNALPNNLVWRGSNRGAIVPEHGTVLINHIYNVKTPQMFVFVAVPGAPPRRVEVEAVNSTALHVVWKPPLVQKQHGEIRGYQVVYSRVEDGEPRGQPTILDIALPDAQVTPAVPNRPCFSPKSCIMG